MGAHAVSVMQSTRRSCSQLLLLWSAFSLAYTATYCTRRFICHALAPPSHALTGATWPRAFFTAPTSLGCSLQCTPKGVWCCTWS